MKDGNLSGLSKSAIIVIGLAALVLMGLAVIAGFTKEVRVNTAATVTDYNLTGLPQLVGNANQYPFLQTFTGCLNATGDGNAMDDSLYDVYEGGVSGGSIELTATGNTTWFEQEVNCSITYLADSSAQAAGDAFQTGLAIFGTFIVIIILSIVGKIIIGFFRKGKGEE